MSEQNNGVRGIYKLSTFITATSLLVVVLLVWAQLWMQPSIQLWGRFYEPVSGSIGEWFRPFNESIGFGLSWIYFAVFLALFALAWAIWKTLATTESKTPDTAIGLFAASIIMGLLSVSQSFFMATMKFIQGGLIYESFYSQWLRWFLLLAVFIVGLSIWGGSKFKEDGKYKYLPWLLEIIIIAIAAGVALGLNWCKLF